MQYLIRKKNNIDIEISKFEDDNEPLGVYTISSRAVLVPLHGAEKHVNILAWQSFGQVI